MRVLVLGGFVSGAIAAERNVDGFVLCHHEGR